MKYCKAVPDGRANKDMWQTMSEGTHGFDKEMCDLLNQTWHEGVVAGTWQHSMSAHLDNHKGKRETEAIRLINMMCPIGNIFSGSIHQRTVETKYNFGYGFYKNRRREQSLIIHHATTWRLNEEATNLPAKEKHKVSHITTLRYVKHAFPSISHEAMCRTLDTTATEKENSFLMHRGKDMKVEIRTKQ